MNVSCCPTWATDHEGEYLPAAGGKEKEVFIQSHEQGGRWARPKRRRRSRRRRTDGTKERKRRVCCDGVGCVWGGGDGGMLLVRECGAG